MQRVKISPDESFFLGSRAFLDLDLAMACLGHCIEGFPVDERNRTAACGELWAFPRVVRCYTGYQVRSRAYVISAVSTAENVHEEVAQSFPPRLTDGWPPKGDYESDEDWLAMSEHGRDS